MTKAVFLAGVRLIAKQDLRPDRTWLDEYAAFDPVLGDLLLKHEENRTAIVEYARAKISGSKGAA